MGTSPTDHLDQRVILQALRSLPLPFAADWLVPAASRWLAPPILGTAALLTQFDAGRSIPRAQFAEVLGRDLLTLRALEGVQKRLDTKLSTLVDLVGLDRWLATWTEPHATQAVLQQFLPGQLLADPKTKGEPELWRDSVADLVRKVPGCESWQLLDLHRRGSSLRDLAQLTQALQHDLAVVGLVRGTLQLLFQKLDTTGWIPVSHGSTLATAAGGSIPPVGRFLAPPRGD